jgi:hypothetical protein
MSMRISLDRNDPGFVSLADLLSDGYCVRVTVNGVEPKSVVTADEEEGVVLAQRHTVEGNPVFMNGVPVLERHTGEVKITVTRLNDSRTLN